MRNRSRTARRLLALALPLCAIVAGLTVAIQGRAHIDRPLVAVLEQRFERTHVGDWTSITGLVVAGGAQPRITEAIRLAKAHPHLKLVLTGPAEEELSAAFTDGGIARERILVEPFAVNTYENAVLSKRLVGPKEGERWLLVTSAYHMPRAIGAFYRAAFYVEPWPVEDAIERPEMLARTAQHEWLGLITYWLRGRSISLFPNRKDLKAPGMRG